MASSTSNAPRFVAFDIEAQSLNTVRGQDNLHCYALHNDEPDMCGVHRWDHEGVEHLRRVIASGLAAQLASLLQYRSELKPLRQRFVGEWVGQGQARASRWQDCPNS